jgi:Kef-type K+ transport system membrane component KefB
VPPETIALALAASIYPPAVAAIIALGRGAHVRTRVLVFVLAAASVTYVAGVLMLFVLVGIGATGPLHYTPSASLELALGLVLIAFAIHLQRKPPTTRRSGSKVERYLRSPRLAFVLGLTLYLLPSPIYVAAVKTVADADFSTGHELLALAITVVVMLWLIELPMVMLLAMPARAALVLDRTNRWFSRRGRLLAVLLCAAAGVYLVVKAAAALAS